MTVDERIHDRQFVRTFFTTPTAVEGEDDSAKMLQSAIGLRGMQAPDVWVPDNEDATAPTMRDEGAQNIIDVIAEDGADFPGEIHPRVVWHRDSPGTRYQGFQHMLEIADPDNGAVEQIDGFVIPELVGFLPVVDAADLRDDEPVDVRYGAVVGVGDLEHVPEAPVPRLGAVAMPDDAGVNLAGEVGAALGDHLGDVLGALVAHVRRGGVLVVRDPDVRGLHPPQADGAAEFLCGVLLPLLGGRGREERPNERPVVGSLVDCAHLVGGLSRRVLKMVETDPLLLQQSSTTVIELDEHERNWVAAGAGRPRGTGGRSTRGRRGERPWRVGQSSCSDVSGSFCSSVKPSEASIRAFASGSYWASMSWNRETKESSWWLSVSWPR